MMKQMLGKLLFALKIGLSEETQGMTAIYNSVTHSVFKENCMWTMRIIKLLVFYVYDHDSANHRSNSNKTTFFQNQ